MKKRTKTQNENQENSPVAEGPELRRGVAPDTRDGGLSGRASATELSSDSQIAELTADLQRTRADFENFRKQTDLQREQAKSAATAATVLKFLPLLDDLDRAFSAYPDQLSALAKSFTKTLKSLDLEQVDSAPGTDFNPDLHEAISMEDGDGNREVIAETLRPGYFYQGQVIRPAMVRVKHEAS